MTYRTLAATLILAVSATSLAVASEIYKWTDDEGNVHYTDVPMGDSSERMNIQSRATDNSRVQAQTHARLDQQAEHAAAAETAAAHGPTAEELQAQAQDNAEKCSMYRDRLTKMVQSRRLYRQDDDGGRVYLDEDEILEARSKVQDQVREYCNS